MAAVRLGQIPLHLREKIVRLINEGKSQREVHRRRTENNCYFADPLPVYLLIIVKTNAHVNTRDSKMLPTNRAMRSDCWRRSHSQFGGWQKPSHYWRGTLKFTNCESIFKPSDSYSVARLPEHCFTEYTKTRVKIFYDKAGNLPNKGRNFNTQTWGKIVYFLFVWLVGIGFRQNFFRVLPNFGDFGAKMSFFHYIINQNRNNFIKHCSPRVPRSRWYQRCVSI